MANILKLITPLFLFYLRFFAHLQVAKYRLIAKLKKQQLLIVGITGSAGKTSTVQACQAALTGRFVVKTNHNYNSQYGLPASILDLHLDSYSSLSWAKVALLMPLKLLSTWSPPEVFLIEMDVDSPHEPENITYLLKIVQPDLAIHLNVSTVHTQNFDSLTHPDLDPVTRQKTVLKLMTQEQAVLTHSLLPHQVAILNLDDPWVASTKNDIQAKIIPITKFSTKSLKFQQQNYLFPKIYDITFGTAITLAKHLGVPESVAIQNIQANFSLATSRSGYLLGKNGSHLIDSSYNASPGPMYEFLDLLKGQKTEGSQTIAILGDMREMGLQTALEHQNLAPYALKSADIVLTVGPQMQKYFPDNPKIHKFLYWWEALDHLNRHPELVEGSTILVKGSQNTIFLEEIVKALLANPQDVQFICRQTPAWLKIKSAFRQSHL